MTRARLMRWMLPDSKKMYTSRRRRRRTEPTGACGRGSHLDVRGNCDTLSHLALNFVPLSAATHTTIGLMGRYVPKWLPVGVSAKLSRC